MCHAPRTVYTNMMQLGELSRYLTPRRLLITAVLGVGPCLLPIVLALVGRCGPTLLYRSGISPDLPVASGFGRLSARTWSTMQTPGRTVHYDGFWDRFWGGMTANHGAVLAAGGPQGVAVARCHGPDGGYVRAWLVVSHATLLTYGVACSLALAVFSTILWFRRPAWFPEGCCAACGYSLHGLPLGRRCPECGTVPLHGIPNKPLGRPAPYLARGSRRSGRA